MAASHTTAAVRTAKSLVTPIPTPVATAQLRASIHDERRSAGKGGGEAWCDPFQAASNTRCVTKPANAPAPKLIAFQPSFFRSGTFIVLPEPFLGDTQPRNRGTSVTQSPQSTHPSVS